jgi:Mg-chelatase subunit ChlD
MTDLSVNVYRNDTHAVVKVTNHELGEVTNKPMIELEFCQDVSGSMGTTCAIQSSQGTAPASRLELCQATLKFTLRYLQGHRVGLTSFDSDARVVFPLQTVGDDSTEIEHHIQQLRPGSSTNLSGGLQKSLLELQESDGSATRVKYLMVFTDGMANAGIVEESGLTALLKNHLEDIPGNVRVVLFAFGNGCNHDLLQKLSESVDGTYHSLQTADDIPTAIGEAFGTALETRQQNLEFVVAPELMEPMSGEQAGFTDILRGESRSRLFKLMDPETFAQESFNFRYLHCETGKTVTIPVDCSQAETDPTMVSEAYNIHDVAETTRRAADLWGEQRKTLLESCLQRLLESISCQQDRILVLINTLREQLRRADMCPPSLMRQYSDNTRNFRGGGFASLGVQQFSQESHRQVSDSIFTSSGLDAVTGGGPPQRPVLTRNNTQVTSDMIRKGVGDKM